MIEQFIDPTRVRPLSAGDRREQVLHDPGPTEAELWQRLDAARELVSCLERRLGMNSYPRPSAPKPGPEGPAEKWLRQFLSNGERLRRDVYTAGSKVGFSERRLNDARRALAVKVSRRGRQGYFWALGGGALPEQ
jgi:hypothetical protein